MTESGNQLNCEREPTADLFVGREWVFLKLLKTLDLRIDCPNTTVILGCPGAGKTILLRKLRRSSKFRTNIIAYYEATEASTAVNLVEELEAQIEVSINPRKSSDCLQKDALKDQPQEMFKQLILFPLIETDKVPEEQRYLIVIDSVDLKKDICELISNHIHLLPKWLHLIVTARPKRRKGFTKMFSGSRKIVIDEMRKVNVINDMKGYIVHRIKSMSCHPLGHSAKKALNQIGIKSNGCFLYVKLILDCIERNLIEIDKEDIGATLNGLYFALFTKLFDSQLHRQTLYKHLLSIILASEDHRVAIKTLQCIFKEDTAKTALQDLALYSLIRVSETDVTITHQSMSEWITDVKHCTRRFLCQPSLGHTILALATLDRAPSELCHHIANSNIDGFEPHHYALWLLLMCSNEELEVLISTVKNSFVVDYIKSLAQATGNRENEARSENKVPSHRPCSQSESDTLLPSRNSRELPTEPSGLEGLAALLDAISKQSLDKVQFILKRQPDLVNLEDDATKKTPLLLAMETRNKALVELLVESDADVNHVCKVDETTPLMNGAKMDLTEICELLLEADADVDACDASGCTPLVYAMLYNVSPKIVEMLLFWGAHTDYIDEEGKSLLGICAYHTLCNVEVIKLLLAVGCDELHKDNFGRTPLHLAAVHGIPDVVEALCDVGGDVLINARDNEGKTALHIASAAGHIEACKILVNPENINVLSHDGRSALRMAAFNGHLNIMSLLFERGADINYVDADGRTTLYCLASSSEDDQESLAVIEHLAKLGANLETRDFEQRTPLHVACWQGLQQTVKTLLDAGADLDACDSENRTPLHMSAWNGYAEIAALLIAAGANINHVSSSQRATPLLIAAQQGHIDVCANLLAAGADVTFCDSYGRNAQDVAANCGHRHIAILIDSHVNSTADPCPTLSSHASTAETAPITDFDPYYFEATLAKSNQEKNCKNTSSNAPKSKKLTPMGKLSKLLR